MRLADPAFNVELGQDRHGHEVVVFSFPYQADIVDALRGVPGRSFDWESKEWSAPRADVVAPYVRGVLERFPILRVSPEVESWLAEAVTGWVGRVTAQKFDGQGHFVLDTIAGELDPDLAEVATERANRLWLPFRQDVADSLLELRGARLDPRALRCATRMQVGAEPARANLTRVESEGEPRLKLEVNWDPDTLPAFMALPACDAHSRTLPVDPFVLEPLEHYLRVHEVEVSATAAEVLRELRREHDTAIEDIRRSRAYEAPALEIEDRLGGELRPFQRAGTRYALTQRRTFLADEQGLGKTVQALAALEADDAFPAVVICPAGLKLNWRREIERWLPHRSLVVVSGTSGTAPAADIVVLNYEIVHAHRVRLALRQPRALVLDESHYVKNPRAKRTQAVRRLADALSADALKLALTGTPVMNHPEELISQLRIIGRLGEFGSGARFARRFRGAGAEARIHWHLRRSCFVRRLKSEVLPQLPAKRQVIVPVALENEREYRVAEQDVIAWLKEQPLDLSELDRKVAAALRAERLAQLNTLKRLAAIGKTGPALAWINDFLQSDEPLVVFAGHREVQDLLVQRFPDALHLLGCDSITAREAAVKRFQEPDGPQLIVCSTRVAAQGITLTRASNVAFLDLEWTPAMHDQAEDRCHRIGQEDAVTAWYLLAANTIDETMIQLIERKRGLVGAVTDGREDESEALMQSVVRELREQPARRRLRSVA